MNPDFCDVPPLCPTCGKEMVELMEERTLEPTTGAVHQRWACPDSTSAGHDTELRPEQMPRP
ncbi:hypothetical protein [Streptomyces sp. NPDC049813]|uniref:hypothetical protein n=1 Tax=Streptomyces sp. NPDC049813 TaxID=3365597 RepID=UPI003797AB26